MPDIKDFEILKCQPGEFVFITYDTEKETAETDELIGEIIEFCQENGTPCLAIPKNEEQFSLSLSQMDAAQLRRLSNRIQAEIKKKSKIILE